MGCDIHARYYVKTASGLREFQLEEHEEPGRSYPLFAALAGVQDAFGVVPIAPPRGFPAELAEHEPQDDVLHGASYLTLAEMLAYDWLGGAWQQDRGFGSALHEYTAPFRNVTLPALARHGDPAQVLMVFIFDN